MQKMIDWMSNVLGPKLSKITQNTWVASVQESFIVIMPFILLGSIMSLIKTLKGLLTWLPYSSMISDYSFGLMGIMVVFLIPYFALRKKGFDSQSVVGGFSALAAYLLLCRPTVTEDGLIAFHGSLGASGLFVSLLVGLLTGAVINFFLMHKFVKDDGVLPTYIANWFNLLLPVALIIVAAHLVGNVANVDLFSFLMTILTPVLTLGQSYIGFVLVYFVMIFLFSFGVNAWAVAAVVVPIWNIGIQANIDAVAAGQVPTAINTSEVIFNGWLNIGGLGCTLPLVIMAIVSKSKRLKAVGKACIVPALFNINEPTIFGLPIAWNPILMIPMWINAVLAPTIVYVALKAGLVSIPSSVYQLSFLPTGINSYFVSNDIRGVILWIVVAIVVTAVYFPFFKAYEKQELEKEATNAEDF
jgi:PTS system cellobiose-specific IIC component